MDTVGIVRDKISDLKNWKRELTNHENVALSSNKAGSKTLNCSVFSFLTLSLSPILIALKNSPDCKGHDKSPNKIDRRQTQNNPDEQERYNNHGEQDNKELPEPFLLENPCQLVHLHIPESIHPIYLFPEASKVFCILTNDASR